MKTAVIYARYSSERQTEQSIEGQLRVCNEYAERNKILIADTYIDRATTGTNDNRASFQKMLKDSEKRAWDYVLVYKLDRFSRNKYEMVMHRKTLRDYGIKILSAMENIPDTPEGITLESLLEGMAEYYSAELSQKVKRGLRETREKCNFTGGYTLYGYKVENKKILIDEEKAAVVRFIFEQYASDVYVKDIMAELNARGIMNRGKPFARNTVYNLLKNEKYSGVWRRGDEVYLDYYPRIVPPEIYDFVKRKIESNRYGSQSREVVYLLREKMFCGYCGSPVSAETGTSKSGKVVRYYKCLGRKRGTKCQKTVLRQDALENLIVETTCKILNNPKILDSIADRIIDVHQKRLKEQSILKILSKERAEVEKSIKNIINAIEQGVVTNSTKTRLNELEEKQSELDVKIYIEIRSSLSD